LARLSIANFAHDLGLFILGGLEILELESSNPTRKLAFGVGGKPTSDSNA
jgi:hypothetical protein